MRKKQAGRQAPMCASSTRDGGASIRSTADLPSDSMKESNHRVKRADGRRVQTLSWLWFGLDVASRAGRSGGGWRRVRGVGGRVRVRALRAIGTAASHPAFINACAPFLLTVSGLPANFAQRAQLLGGEQPSDSKFGQSAETHPVRLSRSEVTRTRFDNRLVGVV